MSGTHASYGYVDDCNGIGTTLIHFEVLIQETEDLLDKWKHPEPYRPPGAPGGNVNTPRGMRTCANERPGTKYERNLPPPILDRKSWSTNSTSWRCAEVYCSTASYASVVCPMVLSRRLAHLVTNGVISLHRINYSFVPDVL